MYKETNWLKNIKGKCILFTSTIGGSALDMDKGLIESLGLKQMRIETKTLRTEDNLKDLCRLKTEIKNGPVLVYANEVDFEKYEKACQPESIFKNPEDLINKKVHQFMPR